MAARVLDRLLGMEVTGSGWTEFMQAQIAEISKKEMVCRSWMIWMTEWRRARKEVVMEIEAGQSTARA
ncbi:hypothetical protein KSP40_PGU013618 [Platanthera guangdongensis]|uniref:Uncharacterized protein n=1 Tax=Platanthera guangdongensis TaxID=2320717 RepID=A0ABR2LS42_9ASPA